jgi:hypothetical protein
LKVLIASDRQGKGCKVLRGKLLRQESVQTHKKAIVKEAVPRRENKTKQNERNTVNIF